jgi:hypothetical protein
MTATDQRQYPIPPATWVGSTRLGEGEDMPPVQSQGETAATRNRTAQGVVIPAAAILWLATGEPVSQPLPTDPIIPCDRWSEAAVKSGFPELRGDWETAPVGCESRS